MTIETNENEHEGVTYSVSPDEKLTRLPAKIRKLVDQFDRTVFLDPDTYLAKLADRCEHVAMRQWLLALVEGGFYQLEIYTAEIDNGNEKPIELRSVYFDYCVGESLRLHSLQFRKTSPMGLIHSDLLPIFDLIECVNPGVWGCALGQLSYEAGESGLFSNMGWMQPSDEIDADQCQQLYQSSDGNVIGCHQNGSAVWCDHGRMEWLGPIGNFLDLYFHNLLNQVSVVDSHELVAQLRNPSHKY